MPDMERVIEELERVVNAIVDGYIHEPDRAANAITNAIDMLKEQEEEIRQLRLALDIAKGTCKGIVADRR